MKVIVLNQKKFYMIAVILMECKEYYQRYNTVKFNVI